MAGVNNRVQLRSQLLGFLRETTQEMTNEVVEVALDATISAEEVVRRTIDTTPSDLSSVPKSNRNWTYNMRNTVDSKVTQTGNTIRLQVGWLPLPAKDNYIRIQEDGGNVNGKTVRAMSALTFAEREMLRILKNKGVL